MIFRKRLVSTALAVGLLAALAVGAQAFLLIGHGPTSQNVLPDGTYIITSGANSVDGSFGHTGGVPGVRLSATTSSAGQTWVRSGGKLSNGVPTTVTVYLNPGTTTWQVPADFSSTNTIEVIGGGSGGANPITSVAAGGGGAGGGYCKSVNVA